MSTLRETTATNTDQITHTDALREAMIGELREMGAIHSDRVAEVFHAVPRHLFTSGASLEEVYALAAVRMKWGEQDVPISTVSALCRRQRLGLADCGAICMPQTAATKIPQAWCSRCLGTRSHVQQSEDQRWEVGQRGGGVYKSRRALD